ncbi:hypothetical protein SK128_016678 [Halocaridina rubra]|uniref:Uncharacterized protein n=1 Tax=Halocaridina rubra TaxID=373956 RepID=A0AAN9A6N3_HALRR
MRIKAFLAVLCLCYGSVVTSDVTIKEASSDQVQNVAQEKTGVVPRDKFLFGSYATATYTQVVASTSTVFFSCLSGTVSQWVCSGRHSRGRRSKKIKKPDINLDDDQSSIGIESSKGDPMPALTPDEDKRKFAFTIWTTSRTTTSVTVFFTDTNTTIRLSYYCFAAGIQYPQFNCAG